MWQPQEDNTYNDLRENSIRQWLEDMSRHEDVAVRGGVKVTAEYLEDLDVGYRARIAGYDNIYCPSAVVYHVGSRSVS